MPLEVISADAAWKIVQGNRHSRYPTPERGADRLYPLPTPETRSRFNIKADSKIFTMGSCFARSVDEALQRAGFKVISRSKDLTAAMERRSSDTSLFNKYTVQSMLNEMRWALDPAQPYPGADALIQVDDEKWADLQLAGKARDSSLADMLSLRDTYGKVMKNVTQADIVIITLGLVEAWFDNQSGLYLNLGPTRQLCERWPGRFELHVLEYNEILETLEQLHALIRLHGKPDVRFLITVSPIPLKMTFRDADVLVANTYSKSVQRAVVEKFVASHEDVDYFPSYEFVTLGNPQLAWIASDFRHVAPSVVDRIMLKVMGKYIPKEDEATLRRARRSIAMQAKVEGVVKSLASPEERRFTLLRLLRGFRERAAGFLLMSILVPLALCGYVLITFVGFFGRTERGRAGVRALDHFVNASLFDGYAWESISSHAWRKRHLWWARVVIRFTDYFQKDHCMKANKREQPIVDLVLSKGLEKQTIF